MVWKRFETLFLCFLSLPCWAKVELSKTVPVKFPHEMREGFTQKDMQKLIPLDMQPTDNANYVATRIGDKAVQAWLNSPAVKNSAMGKTAKQVEGAMKTEVAISQDAGPQKINHRFMFQVQAFQSTAMMKYRGWVNANATYDARARASVVEVTEKVWKDKDVTLSHTASNTEDISALGVRWNW